MRTTRWVRVPLRGAARTTSAIAGANPDTACTSRSSGPAPATIQAKSALAVARARSAIISRDDLGSRDPTSPAVISALAASHR